MLTRLVCFCHPSKALPASGKHTKVIHVKLACTDQYPPTGRGLKCYITCDCRSHRPLSDLTTRRSTAGVVQGRSYFMPQDFALQTGIHMLSSIRGIHGSVQYNTKTDHPADTAAMCNISAVVLRAQGLNVRRLPNIIWCHHSLGTTDRADVMTQAHAAVTHMLQRLPAPTQPCQGYHNHGPSFYQ